MLVKKYDTFSGHRDCIYALASDSNYDSFYSAGSDSQVVKWCLAKPDAGELVARIPSSTYAMAYHEPSQLLWVGQNGEGIHRIDANNKTEHSSLKFTFANIFDIKFYQNNAFVATGDGVIYIIDIEKFALRNTLKVATESVRSIAINPEKEEFVVGCSDFTIKIFSLTDLSLKFGINAHSNSVFKVTYSPDYKYLISSGRDAQLKIWDVAANYKLNKSIAAHLFAINDIVYSPNKKLLATCSMDKSIKIWDAVTFRLLKVVDKARHAGHGTSINKLLWTAYQNMLVSASDDRTIGIWKVENEITNQLIINNINLN